MAIEPHGGKLVNRIADPKDKNELLDKAQNLPTITIGERTISDLEMISIGAYSPLEGFMGSEDYIAVLDTMHLSSGVPWTIPITLTVGKKVGDDIAEGFDIALTDEAGKVLALMTISEKFTYDKKERCKKVFLTEDEEHPGCAATYAMGEVCLAGDITLPEPIAHDNFAEQRLTPKQTREYFEKMGWNTVVGFQTRNPIHRAHEYLQKCAMEIVDGLMVHPIVGQTKEGDISAELRMKCYTELLDNYYPKDRACVVVNPAAMRYAGPREAIFHAIIRKNYGCTHFIVGRDHAGVGNYYGTYDAQHIFAEFDRDALGIAPLFFEHSMYCKVCGGMVSAKTCPHDKSNHIFLSGTKVREMLSRGELPPPEFTRPEIAKILLQAYEEGNN
jgi:sulfate adenylyltransferase